MGIARDIVGEVRSRIDIVDVISEYVTIKRAGKSFKGLCPFHAEKTPSFTVSDEFQTWHCFGCGEHGDVFTFLMKLENLTFPEVLERLAKRAGVELEASQNRQISRRETLADINSIAAAYYINLLKRTPAALEYLSERGLADQTMEQFQIGYAGPDWDGLVFFLGKKGIKLADATEAGLIISRDRSSGYYDRFRNRIIFPITDIQGRVIGFGGRALGDDQPKYLNSSETPLFSKTHSLYGLNFARKKISDYGFAIVVEGYMDAVTAHQAGFNNCIATLGTALTLEHIKLLSRYTNKVVLAYDADSAGMTAALRGASMFDQTECDVQIARFPAGDDPDSLIRDGKVSDFDRAITEALPIPGYKLAVLKDKSDLSTPAGRSAMLKEAAKILAEVPLFAERERYIGEIAKYHPNWETGTTRAEEHIRADIESLIKRKQGKDGLKSPRSSAPKPLSALEKAERVVLRALIKGEDGAIDILDNLSPEVFSTELTRKVAQIVFEMFRQKKGIYQSELLEKTDSETSGFISELLMREDGPPISRNILQDCITCIKNSKLGRKRTSDVCAPYMKDGIIDPNCWSSGQTSGEYEDYLRKSGRLNRADE